MNYGDSVQKVLLRKIRKTEQDMLQLKLDYCRFIFGLTHRARVLVDGEAYLVRSVDVDSMVTLDDGSLGKPVISGVPAGSPDDTEAVELGREWTLAETASVK